MSISNDVLVIAVVVALTFLMWLMLRETFGAKRHLRERLDHLPALRVPGDLVDRLRLRLLVEPDLRRGGDAHRPCRPAGGCARRQRRRRRAARCRARPARQRGELVGQPDDARGDERRQLRHALGRRPRAALQCAAQRARFHQHPARRHDAVLVRAGAGRRRAAQAERGRRSAARTVEERQRAFESQGLRHPRPRAQHRRAQQPARQVDRRRDARARRRGGHRAGRAPASPATTRRWPSGCARPRRRPSSPPSSSCARPSSTKARPASPTRSRTCGATSAPTASSLAAYVFSGGKQAAGRTDTGEPITGRDLIALLATIGIDLGLLALAIVNPPREPPSIRPSGALTTADQRGDRHRNCPRRRRPRMGAPAFHPSQRARPIWSSPTSTAAIRANEDGSPPGRWR